MSKRVAIYCRVSTIEQAEEGYSIDEQQLKLRQHCEFKDDLVVELYEDRGISGKNISGRPGLKKLLDDASKNKFDLVLVWKLNRISRNLYDILKIVDLLDKNNIAFRSLSESFETETPQGRLQLNIIGAIGEFERETISENVKLGMSARAREGKWNGGKVLGYDIVEIPSEGKKRKNTKLVINETEATTIRRIFELYSKGNGYKAVVNTINKEGHRSKRGNAFATATVKEILTNPVYIGMIRYNLRQDWNKKRRKGINPNPILVEGEHDAIIDRETWEKVQVINKQRSKKQQRRYSTEALLTGILKCPVCGSAMTISRTTNTLKDGTKKVAEYYACGAWKSKGTAVCNSNTIKINKADEYVLDKVMELVNEEVVLKKIVDNINKNKSNKLKPLLKSLDVVNKEIDKFNNKKNKSIELFEDGILTKVELAERIKVMNEDIEKLSYRKKQIQQEIDISEGEPIPFEVVKEVFDKFGQIFRELGTKEQRKQIIHLLISKVTMNKSREIDSINIEINNDVITYLMKDGLPKQQANLSFLYMLGINGLSLKIVI